MLQGFNAFLSDAGLPYDILVDTGGKILKVQVKGSQRLFRHPTRPNRVVYRFGLRRGRGSFVRIDPAYVDIVACVALDKRLVAYVRIDAMITEFGKVPGLIEIADETDGKRWGRRTFQKCGAFPVAQVDSSTKECFRCNSRLPATPEFFSANARCRQGITGICLKCVSEDGKRRYLAKKGISDGAV